MLYSAIDHPANAGLRRYRESHQIRRNIPPLARPDEVTRPYDSLGTHPDLVARLWHELPAKLPVDCRVIFYGGPALMHPTTGVVFAFAGGTHTYALRLPEAERSDALRAGATRVKHYPAGQSFDLTEVGDQWVFCGWFRGEEEWCLAAFELAAV
jgi:hypothetical protein